MEESSLDLRKAYGETLRDLDDLRRLGGPSIAPIAGQLQFRLSNVFQAASSLRAKPHMFPQIIRHFDWGDLI